MVRTVRRAVTFVIFLVVLGLLYSAYKALGQALDDAQTDWWAIGSFLPATNDLVMPPLLDIVGEWNERSLSQVQLIDLTRADGSFLSNLAEDLQFLGGSHTAWCGLLQEAGVQLHE